jgi:hypothetical protein
LVRDKSIGRLDLFTMTKFHELADNCEQVYRKSLLYLIYYGLEPQRKTPILGLDESLRADRALRELFGLNGRTASTGEVVWSPSAAATGRSASRSLTHGGFDNDRATMESVARRIVNRDDIEPFPEAMIGRVLARAAEAELPVAMGPPAATPTGFAASPVATAPTPVSDFRGAVSAGRRRALCVGIDDYPTSRLQGCVRDARTWSQTLQQLGFEAQLLLDGQASREAMLQALTELVATSRAGDVVAFQFAGHGTTLPDLNGDETGGDTPGQDEAFVPHDYQRGAFLIDDDVAGVFRRIPAGVNVTCFIDCCHSGTITRLLVGVRPPPLGPDERPRFMAADAAMMESHRQFRAAEAGRAARAVVPPRDPEAMSEVLFSACRSDEVALESNGQGEFTVRATRLLQRGLGGMTNADFQQQVVAAFGSAPRQHPQLDCAAGARRRALLLPLAGAGRDPLVPAAGEGPPAGAGLAGGDLGAIANGLRAFADLLQPRA